MNWNWIVLNLPIISQLRRIEAKIDLLLTRMGLMAGELEALQAAVAAEDTVIGSAITLLNGLKAALDAAIASGNTAALVALSADIGAQTQALSDAITANTPAAPVGGAGPTPSTASETQSTDH